MQTNVKIAQTPGFTLKSNVTFKAPASHVCPSKGFESVGWHWWARSVPSCSHANAQTHGPPAALLTVTQTPCQNITMPIQ